MNIVDSGGSMEVYTMLILTYATICVLLTFMALCVLSM
jgi:hypothetical protein